MFSCLSRGTTVFWFCLGLPFSTVCGLPSLSAIPRTTSGGTFSVSLTRNDNYAPAGPLAHARALLKWGADVPENLAQWLSEKSQVGNVPAWNQSNDKEYLSPTYIGTPGQLVYLDFDTGSSDLWVFSSETASPVGARAIWHPENSSTASSVKGSTWAIQYGDGSYAEGDVYKDTVKLGDITLPNVYVESAKEVSESISIDPNLSGLMGLAYSYPSTVLPTEKTLLNILMPTLDKPIFTVDLNWEANGTYIFGQEDHSRNLSEIAYTPLLDTAKFWQFNYTGINVGSSDLWRLSSWSAIADTGTSLLLLPDDMVSDYYAAVNGSSFNDDYQGYVFPCTTDPKSLPDFNIGFANHFIARVPGEFMMYMQMDPTNCYGGIQSNEGLDFAIFGDVFLKALVAYFDVGGARVGFASKAL